jgi:hypothetical protein
LWYICESAPMATMSMLDLHRHAAASICWRWSLAWLVCLVERFES